MNTRQLIIKELRADKVLRVYPHVGGGWFWSKYSASPYLGCQCGCTYCFLRASSYGMTVKNSESTHLTDSFSQYIRVITNAAELLDQELQDTPKDIIVTGDYQPLDARFRLSRALLQTCLNHGFPTAVVSKSPGVVRDLDLVCEIGRKSWACLAFSIGYLQSDGYWRIFEPDAPSIESRFRAMRRASDAGIYVGTALIPVLPFITDSDDQLAVIIKRTRDSGGQFVLAGGLVLGADVRTEFYRSLERMGGSPLVNRYQRLYGGGFSPTDNSWARLGRTVRELCERCGLEYRIRRFIPNDGLAENKRLAERLFLRIYELELDEMHDSQISACRNLAWMIDESTTPVTEQSFREAIGLFGLDEGMVTRGWFQRFPGTRL